METPKKCIHCERREQKDREQEETNMAVLLAMVPLLTLAFFGQVGLL